MEVDELNNLAAQFAVQIAIQSQDKEMLCELAVAFKQLGAILLVIAQRMSENSFDSTQETLKT